MHDLDEDSLRLNMPDAANAPKILKTLIFKSFRVHDVPWLSLTVFTLL